MSSDQGTNSSHSSDDLERLLMQHVSALSREIGERHIWRPRALTAAAEYIEGEFRRAGYEVRRQPFDVEGVACANLEVELRGMDPTSPMVLVGAHYDTVEGSPGADDNASGIASMLEIARLLHSQPLRATVRCVAFVNEEAPFFGSPEMGSRIYARACRANGDRIKLMLSLEMLGYFSSRPGSQRYPPLLRHWYPDRGNFIAFVSNLRSRGGLAGFHKAFRAHSSFPSERLASPGIVPGVSLSDQRSFWQEAYPALMVTDTAFYRYPHYHRSTDTPEKLDYASMARVTAGLANAVAAFVR